MGIFTTTTKAYWRECPEQKPCTTCKADGVRTWQTGHKPRRAKEVQWWSELRWCDGCKAKLPHTPPPFD